MKYLILGASGLIGQHLCRLCRESHIPFVGTALSRQNQETLNFDLLDFQRLPHFFDEVSPTVVINSTGLAGGVNFCEDNPETGYKYHVLSNQLMVDWCQKHDAVYTYISTDYVFDGKNPPYKEDDETAPLNLYGRYKLEGEQYIRQSLKKYIIARTTNVFAWDPGTRTPNFLMHLVQTLETQDSMKVPAFLYGNPTHAGDLAAGIMELIAHGLYDLYHIVGSENIDRFTWASKFLAMAGIKNKTLEPIKNPPTHMVPRPLNSHLDTGKFRSRSHIPLHNVEQGLQLFIQAMTAGKQ